MREREKMNREMKVLLIFLEHPGGLRFEELWRVVKDGDICARQTLRNMLKSWVGDGLIEKSELGRYTLGFTEPVAQTIKQGAYELPERVGRFLDALYKGHERLEEKQAELFSQLGGSYLGKELRQLLLTTWLLFPYLFDEKVREIWFLGHKYALNLLFDKIDEMSQKFYGVKISHALRTTPIQEKFMTPQLEQLIHQIKLEDKKIAGLIDQLDIEDGMKQELKSQLVSGPFFNILLEEYKTWAKIIQTLTDIKKKSG